MEYLVGAVIGAVIFGLVLRNNPTLAKKLGLIVDEIEDKLDKK